MGGGLEATPWQTQAVSASSAAMQQGTQIDIDLVPCRSKKFLSVRDLLHISIPNSPLPMQGSRSRRENKNFFYYLLKIS